MKLARRIGGERKEEGEKEIERKSGRERVWESSGSAGMCSTFVVNFT